MPPSAARLCYYAQLLDDHGNGSPMALLGCKEAGPATPPKPVLAEPVAATNPGSAQVTLNWFCPTAGVSRFQIMIKRVDKGGDDGFVNPVLTPAHFFVSATATVVPLFQQKITGILKLSEITGIQYTPKLSSGFGPGPQFTLTAGVLKNVPYEITVASVNATGDRFTSSETWPFTWTPPTPRITVPWPARPLPPVQAFDRPAPGTTPGDYASRVQAVLFTNEFDGKLEDQRYPVGIRIGQFTTAVDASPNIGATDFVHYFPGQIAGVVQFGDGAVGVRPAGGSDGLQVTHGLGLGAAGNVITGFAPLGMGRFALLTGVSNTFSSAQAQVFTKSGSNYVVTSTSTLPKTKTTSNATRANVWLFASEPFVNSQPGFVASLNGGDWITSLTGLPGAISVVAEMDRGVTNGLGNPTAQNLTPVPASAVFGVANQYHPAISLFSYASVRAAEPAIITISPPAGHYENPIAVFFTTGDPGDQVWFRVGPTAAFELYAAPVALDTNARIQFYGTAGFNPDRTTLQTASYTFTDHSIPPLVTTNGTGTNGIPPVVIPTNEIPTYAYGTVIYGRRNAGSGSIWAINLDGTGDHYITDGARPRLSPEGRYLAFLREGNPFAQVPINNGNIWVRDLLTGAERRLVTQTSFIVGFDWGYGTTNLFYDDGCNLWQVGLDGVPVTLPLPTHCNDDAPTMNPIDGRLALHNLGATVASQGLFITDETLTTKQKLALGNAQPHWPSWSPDGTQLAFANYDLFSIPASAQNLFVVEPDGTGLHQITGLTQVEGFRYGAQWSPGGDALVGAATLLGVNGVWIVPLTPDRDACGAPPIRLPTTPGDPIDFVGTVFIPPRPPNLTIRRELDDVIVSWRRTAWPYVLQTADEPTPSGAWLSVPPPYPVTGSRFEYRVSGASLQPNSFFRLRLP